MKLLLIFVALVGATSAVGIVTPALKASIESRQTDEAILELPQVIDEVLAEPSLQTLKGDTKASALVDTVAKVTAASQAPFLAAARTLGLTTETFWGSNIILIKGLTIETLAKLAATPGTFTLRPQFTASILPSVVNHGEVNVNVTANTTHQLVQWGVTQIRAPQAWAVTSGDGCVAGIIDTGVNVGHEALSEGFAGGADAWMDPYYNTSLPTDQLGHGSHCLGSLLGRTNGIGVAPGATWVACRGLNHQGSGTEANLIRCGEFMLTANPRPNLVSNSWGGGSGLTWYNSITTLWKSVDIVPLFAVGASGPSCRSVSSPADQPGLIGVSATARNDIMTGFSERGPSVTGLRKPDVSAPGADIVSCGTGTDNYVSMSGGSMATPHVAGAVCLILSQTPGLTFEQVVERLESTAAHPTLSVADRSCGLYGSGDFPNNAFGAGRIDAGRAVGV